MNKNSLWYGLWFTFVFLLDRLTKQWALSLATTYVVTPFLAFQLVFNRGISWGMLHSDNQIFFSALTACIVIIILLLARHTYMRYKAGRKVFAEIMVLAGAVSNLVDRIVYHGVIDFIHMHLGDWSWPIFNIADTAIVLGIFWMLKEHYNE